MSCILYSVYGQSGHQCCFLECSDLEKTNSWVKEVMAQFVIGSDLVDDSVRKEKERKEVENQEKARRHYKKDSR